MEIFKWSEELKTNNMKIDEDHRKIINKAAELSNAMMSGKGTEHLTEMIDFLSAYVKKHFREEEMLQKNSGYPDYLSHKRKHDYFIKEIDELAKAIHENPTSSLNSIKLNNLMSGWFFSHIKKLDKDVAKHIKK